MSPAAPKPFVHRSLWLAVLIALLSTPARAQEGLPMGTVGLVGIAVVVVLLLALVAARRRRKPSASSTQQEPSASPDAPPPTPAATVKSTMGLMSTQAEGPFAGKYYEILEQGLTIGRDAESCQVVFEDERVSRQHARLEYGSEGLMLRNLSTTNQTFLNDQAIAEAVVRSGDRIRIEQVTFRVYPHRGAAGR